MSICISTALLICCAPFVAQEEAPLPQQPAARIAHHKASPDELALRMLVRSLLLQRYDADQNGHLDRAEREQIHHETRETLRQQAAAVAAQFDHDKDGRLSPEEREEMRHSLKNRGAKKQGRHHRHHKKHFREDAHAPRQQVDGERVKHPRKPRRHRRMGRFAREMAFISHRLMLQTYDADSSGQLEEQEMAVIRQDAAKLYQKRKSELLQRFDTDQDGSLSEAEFHAAKAQLEAPPRADNKRHRLSPEATENMTLLRHLFSPACSPSTN